jgi:hypothetical protein
MDSPTKAPGRPTKVSVELAKRIAQLIVSGNSMRESAEASGLDGASLFNYLAWAKAGDPAFQEFARIIEDAKTQRTTWRRHAQDDK